MGAPTVEAAVFDEAHHLGAVAQGQFTESMDLMRGGWLDKLPRAVSDVAGAIAHTPGADVTTLARELKAAQGELARLVFHELAHQVVYAKDDTAFNESFATAVERIGGARWLQRHASPQAREEYAAFDARRQDFRTFTMDWRDRLDAIYRSSASDDDKRARKAEAMAQMRAAYEAMKHERWGGFSGYDGWFARANNASFGVLAAYNALVPDFERLFERSGRDFERFYAEVKRLAALPKAQRRAELSAKGD